MNNISKEFCIEAVLSGWWVGFPHFSVIEALQNWVVKVKLRVPNNCVKLEVCEIEFVNQISCILVLEIEFDDSDLYSTMGDLIG